MEVLKNYGASHEFESPHFHPKKEVKEYEKTIKSKFDTSYHGLPKLTITPSFIWPLKNEIELQICAIINYAL